MSGPIKSLFNDVQARWTALGYAWSLVYGSRQAWRQDLDAVATTGGRVVIHAGLPGEEGDAGELDAQVLQAFESGRAIATDWSTFTVHCHGYDSTAPEDELAQDDAAWCLKEAFFGAFHAVLPGKGRYWRLISQVWVRSPQERRFGEVLRLVMQVSFAIRQAPEYPNQTAAAATPTATVQTPGGPVVAINGE